MQAHLADGTILEFPDGTDQAVIDRVVKQHLGVTSEPAPPNSGPQPRTTLGGVGREAALGTMRAAQQTAGLLMDAPARVADLGVAAVGAPYQALTGKPGPQLPFDPNYFTNQMTGYEAKPTTPTERFAGTTAEISGQGVLGGGLQAAVPSVLAGLSGATGEQIWGPKGRLLAMAPGVASLGLNLGKYLVRGGATQAAARVKSMEDAGLSPVAGDLGTRAAVLEKTAEYSPLGYRAGVSRAKQRAEDLETALAGVAGGRQVIAGTEKTAMGNLVEKGLQDWRTRTNVNYQALRQNTERMIPPTTAVPLPRTQAALRSVGSSIDDPAISQLLEPQLAPKLGQAIAANTEGFNWRTVEAMKTRIGSMAFGGKPVLVGDMDKRQLATIYRALGEDQAAVARTLSPAAATSLAKQNAYYTARMSRVEDYLGSIYSKAGHPEAIADTLLSGATRDSEKVRAVMKSLQPGERTDLATLTVQEMGKAKPGAIGDFSPETFLTNWQKMNPRARDALFGHDAQLKADLDKLVRGLEISRETARTLANPSGTGPAVTATAALGGIAYKGLTGQWGQAAAITGALVAGGVSANLMTYRPFVHWLARGVTQTFPPERLASQLAQLADEANDPAVKEDLAKFRAALK